MAYFFAVLSLGGLGYLSLSLFGAHRFFWTPQPKPGSFTPPISILKPLYGVDRDMYEGFRSHCLQKYPQYEIVFGVHRADDPALTEVERLRTEFPNIDIRLVVCPELLGTNGKVSSLVQMLDSAKYDYVLINDSDIRVASDYLQCVMSHFADENVGLVTALYRANAGRGLSSRIEAVTVGTDFVGGVLSALALEKRMKFALGSTLALRRGVLDEIGGLRDLLDHLADDYELGARTARAGYKVALSNTVVDTYLPDYNFAAMFQHQLRWSRTIRDMRKLDYIGTLFTYALPWAVLCALFAKGAAWSLALLGVVALVRFATGAVLAELILRDRRTLRDLWLIPVRDFIGVAIWIASFASNTITWRGITYHLENGKLRKI